MVVLFGKDNLFAFQSVSLILYSLYNNINNNNHNFTIRVMMFKSNH
jgi:hypothetical protein